MMPMLEGVLHGMVDFSSFMDMLLIWATKTNTDPNTTTT